MNIFEERESKIIEYLMSDGMTHALDLHTTAKKGFWRSFLRAS